MEKKWSQGKSAGWEARMSSRSLRPIFLFDWLIIGYCFWMALLIAFIGRPLSEYWSVIIFYLSMAAITSLFVRYVELDRNRWLDFVRLMYPMFMGTLFYNGTAGTMNLLFDNFLDGQLAAFEKSLFGENLTIYIDRYLQNAWVTELLSFCYFCYYLMIPGFLTVLFIKQKYELIISSTATISLTFFLSYQLFFLYPIEGPRWFFAGQYLTNLDGFFFRSMVEYVIDNGAIRGGCMPSTHFAIALVVMLYCLKHYRRAGLWLIVVNSGLALGTVWGRFHYISDVVVGGIIATLSYWAVTKLFDPLRLKEYNRMMKTEETKSVS